MSDFRRFVKYLAVIICFMLIYWYISAVISVRQEEKQKQMNDAIRQMQKYRN